MDYDYSGKVVAVTGATGISMGVDIAKAFFECGAMVSICGRYRDRVNDAVEKIGGTDKKRIFGTVADMSDVAQCQRYIQETVEHFGRIDILINNAGVQIAETALEITQESWDATFDTKARGYFFCSQAAAKDMIRRGEPGNIIMIGSGHSEVQRELRLSYAAANSSVDRFTRSLAREWGTYGIRVNCLQPGSFPTGMSKKRFDDDPTQNDIYKELPLGRRGKLKEMADACLFFASDKASYITGVKVPIDGGWVLCM